MSITLVTGVPGSGKTLYTISKLLKPLIGSTVPNGNSTIDRVVFTNINGLLLDHELIDGSDTGGLRNWHQWAQAGSVICFDEFQKIWAPRPNGSRVPDDIQALDTHRHKGVDFILITQNCMNVDRHILGLVDRHLHIRRVANMSAAIVYEWDHASRQLRYKDSMTKSPWRYDKDTYKLYKSAEVHTKQKRKMPGLVWFIIAGLAGAAYLIPNFYDRITERMTPQGQKDKTEQVQPDKTPSKNIDPQNPKPGEKVTYVRDGITYTIETAKLEPPDLTQENKIQLNDIGEIKSKFAGCIALKNRCECLDTSGKIFLEPQTMCDDLKNRPPPLQFEQTRSYEPIHIKFNQVIGRP